MVTHFAFLAYEPFYRYSMLAVRKNALGSHITPVAAFILVARHRRAQMRGDDIGTALGGWIRRLLPCSIVHTIKASVEMRPMNNAQQSLCSTSGSVFHS